MIRIIPNLPNIKAHWDKRTSAVPDYLMVPMSDNSVVRYVPDIQQPRPVLAEQLKKFSNLCKGYESKVAMGGADALPGQMTIDDFIKQEE